jgi:acyl-CoA dehydrogenase
VKNPLETASPRARELIEAYDAFVDEQVRPLEESLGRHRGERLEPDGRLAAPFVEAKREVNRRSARAGLYALHLPKWMAGRGFPLVDLFHLHEHLFRRGYTLALDAMAHLEGPSPNLQHLSDEVRDRYLGRLLEGRIWQCGAVTEPRSGGSDIPSMGTTATRTGDGWRLEGHKWLISYAPFAELAQIYAVTDRSAGTRGLTGFMVQADWPGFRRGAVNRTMIDDGVTGELHLDGVEVPDENRIGAEGEGVFAFLEWINWTRVRRGGQSAGLAWYCYDTATRALDRRRGGGPLGRLQTVQFRVVDMYMDIMRTRAFVLRCLQEIDAVGGPWRLHPNAEVVRNVCMVKVAGEEMLFRVADEAVQLLGGLGLLKEVGIEHVFRVARNLRIPGGSSELMRDTIAKTLLPSDMFV